MGNSGDSVPNLLLLLLQLGRVLSRRRCDATAALRQQEVVGGGGKKWRRSRTRREKKLGGSTRRKSSKNNTENESRYDCTYTHTAIISPFRLSLSRFGTLSAADHSRTLRDLRCGSRIHLLLLFVVVVVVTSVALNSKKSHLSHYLPFLFIQMSAWIK